MAPRHFAPCRAPAPVLCEEQQPPIWLMLEDGSMQMLTEPRTAWQVAQELRRGQDSDGPLHLSETCRVVQVASGEAPQPLRPEEPLLWGNAYQVLPAAPDAKVDRPSLQQQENEQHGRFHLPEHHQQEHHNHKQQRQQNEHSQQRRQQQLPTLQTSQPRTSDCQEQKVPISSGIAPSSRSPQPSMAVCTVTGEEVLGVEASSTVRDRPGLTWEILGIKDSLPPPLRVEEKWQGQVPSRAEQVPGQGYRRNLGLSTSQAPSGCHAMESVASPHTRTGGRAGRPRRLSLQAQGASSNEGRPREVGEKAAGRRLHWRNSFSTAQGFGFGPEPSLTRAESEEGDGASTKGAGSQGHGQRRWGRLGFAREHWAHLKSWLHLHPSSPGNRQEVPTCATQPASFRVASQEHAKNSGTESQTDEPVFTYFTVDQTLEWAKRQALGPLHKGTPTNKVSPFHQQGKAFDWSIPRSRLRHAVATNT